MKGIEVAVRPYIQYSAIELKVAIEKNEKNTTELKAIVAELGFRKKSKNSLAPSLALAKKYILANGLRKEKPKKSAGRLYERPNSVATPSKSIPPRSTGTIRVPRKSKSYLEEMATANAHHEYDPSDTGFEEPMGAEQEEKNGNQATSAGRPGSIRKASNSLKGLPNVWSPEIKETFPIKDLDVADTQIEKFICALNALIWEIRKNAKFSKTIYLTNGRREKSLSGEYGSLYSFTYVGDEELFEGARIDFQVGTKKTKGSIVSMLPGKLKTIIISLESDFGNIIPQCSITQDEAALLEALQKRLEIEIGKADKKVGAPVGMNTALADLLLTGESEECTSDYREVGLSELNHGQKAFFEKAIQHTISFLWGPPGTGKTKTLGSIITYFYDNLERTFICSNTNQAVDQVLLHLCKELENQNRFNDLEDGKIIRVGRIAQAELSERFSQYITVDGIADRKGSKITKKINQLEANQAKSEQLLDKYHSIIDGFSALNELKENEKKGNENAKGIEKNILSEVRNRKNIENQLEVLQLEKTNYANKGFFARAFARSGVSIESEIKTQLSRQQCAEKNFLKLTDEFRQAQDNHLAFGIKIKNLELRLAGQQLRKIKEQFDQEDKKISSFNLELLELKKQIENLRKTILSEATVIGATLTKSFLSPSDLGKFQNIVIDEASMGLLPAIYFTASQSERRCIISGDFRQLPPIIQSSNKAILDILGSNIFEFSGFEDWFTSKKECDYAGVLTEQYRMEPKICRLISEIGYEGELFTSLDRETIVPPAPQAFTDSVIIVDTSSVYPFTDRDPYGSTSNIVHALLARNIMRKFSLIDSSGSMGYCAPFKAQTKLMKKMVVGEPNEQKLSIGTIHTFQGDEKNTIIFDTVNSLGEKHFINPGLAQETASKSNILTVAVSRAAERIIFIANLRYLDSKIPAMGYLRKILYDAQTQGTVIDAKNIIDLVPLEEELDKFKVNIQELNIPSDALKSGLVNEDVFYPLLKRDLSQAKRYIAFYSGFYTANRVNDLLHLLADKVNAGVKIRAVLPPPDGNGSMGEAESEMVSERLEAVGVLVEFRARIHQKAVLIDEDISWFGSLNPLSFSGGTEESMLRVEQKNITGTFAANMAVNRKAAKEDPALMVTQEVPNCSDCGHKTVFHRGRYGPWIKCRSCGKTENLRRF